MVQKLTKTGGKPKRRKNPKKHLKVCEKIKNKIRRKRPERDTWRMVVSAPSGADHYEAPEGALVNYYFFRQAR